jgi:hypothetical protein
VTYENWNRETVAVENSPAGVQSTEEFLRLLHNPVDWTVAQEDCEVKMSKVNFEGIQWEVPAIGEWNLNQTIIPIKDRPEELS